MLGEESVRAHFCSFSLFANVIINKNWIYIKILKIFGNGIFYEKL